MTMKRPDNIQLQDEVRRKRPKLESPTVCTRFPDWEDDDLNGDLLEEACVIAELTQCISTTVNSSAIEILEENSEIKRLKDSLKTKEGEIVILRSQIRNHETNKRTDSISHLKAIDQIKKNAQINLESAKKEAERLRNELEFKDLEVKGLVQKCRDLELANKSTEQPCTQNVDQRKNRLSLTQAVNVASTSKLQDEPTLAVRKRPATTKVSGPILFNLVPAQFFDPLDDPCLSSSAMYKYIIGESSAPSMKLKDNWSNYPHCKSSLHLVYPLLLRIYKDNDFDSANLYAIIRLAKEILNDLKTILTFLQGLPLGTEHEEKLLEDVGSDVEISLEDLLGNAPVKTFEMGIEARRILALLTCIVRCSCSTWRQLAELSLLHLLKDVATIISELIRPVEFTGVLISILMLLQAILDKNADLEDNLLKCLRTTVEVVIFSRPKLDVLLEVIKTLSKAAKYVEVSHAICRRSTDAGSLYMDSKLRQAIFFSKDACPLRLLQVQVKTLSHLTKEPPHLLKVVKTLIHWLQCLLLVDSPTPHWLIAEDEHCCDIIECFTHLLYLCVPYVDNDNDVSFKFALETGIMTLRNCCKAQSKKLKSSSLKLLPIALRSTEVLGKMAAKPRQAALWLIADYENEIQEYEALSRSRLSEK